MKFGFVTCVRLGLDCIEEIYRAGGALDLAITLPDDRAPQKSGRVYLDDFCKRHGIELLKFANVNEEECVAAVRKRQIDWLFIIGWSQIAHPPMLAAPRKGALGMHPTLLPQGRGRAAIPWAIIKGLTETGVTLFKLDEGVDTGPVLAQEVIPIDEREDASTLYDKVALAHRRLMRRIWADLTGDRLRPRPQDDTQATNWPGRRPEDGRLTASMTVAEVDRMVRAVTHPYPGAFLEQAGSTLRIWRGQIGENSSQPPTGARRLRFADGVFDAVDYQEEQAGHPVSRPSRS